MKAVKKYRDLIVNGGWVLSLTAVRQALGLLLVMVLVRVISKDEFGQYQFVVASIGLCGIFTLQRMQNTIVQSVARGFDGTYRATVKVVLASSLVGSLLLAGIGFQQWFYGRESLLLGLLIAASLFPFAQGLLQWASYQAGKELFRLNAIYMGIGYIVAYSGAILTVLFLDAHFVWVVLIVNGVIAIQNVCLTIVIFRRIPADAPAESGAIRYGLQTSAYNAFNIAGNYVDKFLLFFLLSPEALAVFVIAERIPELLKDYLQQARNVLVPGLSRKSVYTKSLNRKLNRASLVISLGVLGIAVGVIPWLMPLAFTEAYGETVFYCQLLLGTLIVGQAATTKYTFIISRLDARSFRDVTIGTNIVRIVASASLIPFFGIYGAIGAAFAYRLATVAFVNYYLWKFHIRPIPDE